MKQLVTPILIVLTVSFAGCSKTDSSALLQRIEKLESEMGYARYAGLSPNISVLVEERGFRSGEYGNQEYFLKGKVRLLDSFPVDVVGLNVTYKLTFSDGSSHDGVIIVDEFETRKGSEKSFDSTAYMQITDETLLGDTPKLEGIELNWWSDKKVPIELKEI